MSGSLVILYTRPFHLISQVLQIFSSETNLRRRIQTCQAHMILHKQRPQLSRLALESSPYGYLFLLESVPHHFTCCRSIFRFRNLNDSYGERVVSVNVIFQTNDILYFVVKT